MRSLYTLIFCSLITMFAFATPSKDGLDVPAEFKVCKVDSDCVQVGSDCAGCCKSEAIQKSFKVTYNMRLKEVCSSYHGPVCDCCGPDFHPKCINSKCSLVEVPGSRKSKCGQ